MSKLKQCIDNINTEIELFENYWDIDFIKNPNENDLSTCQLKMPENKKIPPQAERQYLIKINKKNPLDYKGPLNTQDLIDMCLVHEKTHALCDLSYTCNYKESRLGTWNDSSKVYNINCKNANAKAKRIETIDNNICNNTRDYTGMNGDSKIIKIFSKRIGYGWSYLIDIDTVVNELCMFAYRANMDESLPMIKALISFANDNISERKAGRSNNNKCLIM